MLLKKIFVFLLFCALFSSCQKSTKETTKQFLRLNIHSEPPTLDSRKATDTTSAFVIKQIREGLMRFDKNQHIEFAVAENAKVSPDGLTYTFYLKKCLWSDGTPLTANDFVRTWKTIITPSFPSENAYELYVIKNAKDIIENRTSPDTLGVKALDEYTLQINLEHPVPYFFSLLTTPTFFPSKEIFDPYISNGPFVLKRWRHFDELDLTKNTLYWDQAQVRLEALYLFVIDDDHTELNLFENGELDWAGHPFTNLPSDALDALAKRETIFTCPLSATYHYIFNTQVYPLNNAHIRRALSFAINRKSIVDNILQMGQKETFFVVPPTMWKQVAPPDMQPSTEEAKVAFERGLEELNITKDEFPTLTISYNTMVGHHKIAQAIQQDWKETLGIDVRLQNKDWKVFLDDTHRGQFEIARSGGVASIDDPITFLDIFQYPHSARNSSKWHNAAYTKLIRNAEQTNDPIKRMQLLKNAETLLIEEMPIAPIFIYSGSYLKKPYVKNISVSPLGDMDLRYAYIAYDENKTP